MIDRALYEKKKARGSLPWAVCYDGEEIARFLVENLADDLLLLLQGKAMLMQLPEGGVLDGQAEG